MLADSRIAARPPRRGVHLLVLVALLGGLAAGLVGPAPRGALAATARTTADLNLRSGPDTTNHVLRVMPAGVEVELGGGQEGNWYQVSYAGASGWAAGDYLDFGGGGGGGGGATGNASVAVNSLNLRADASTTSAVLAVMPRGASVTVTGQRANGFVTVSYNGTNGWAYESYLSSGSSGGNPNPNPNPAPAPDPGPTGSATVTVNALNLRANASTNSGVLAVMPAGAGVTLTGQRSNGFVSVTFNGTNGWAYEAYLNVGGSPAPNPSPNPAPNPAPDPGPTGSATVTVNALNLRANASTNSGVLAVMPAGAGVTLTGQRSNGFVSVTFNGTNGWAYEAYLNVGGSPAPNPSPSPNPNPAPDPGSGLAVTTANMNMRSSANTSSSVVTVVPAGAAVTLTGIAQNGFYYVIYNGVRGWIAATGLVLGGAPNPNPGGSGLRGDTNGDGVLSQQEVIEIIYAAADRYGQPRADMLRVARCESNLLPSAVNPAGSYGLFQFVPFTWATTPFADESIFDAYASANAAGWMWSVGRRNEWVCQ